MKRILKTAVITLLAGLFGISVWYNVLAVLTLDGLKNDYFYYLEEQNQKEGGSDDTQ